jgi:hypothetical protein
MSELILGCCACSNFTGYIPRKTPPPKTINTTCGVCGARLRFSPDSYVNGFKKSQPKGRGAHNRSQSVWMVKSWDRETKEHSAKKEASLMNREKRKIKTPRENGFETRTISTPGKKEEILPHLEEEKFEEEIPAGKINPLSGKPYGKMSVSDVKRFMDELNSKF